MQNSDASLATIPEQAVKDLTAGRVEHVSDKNHIDPIARSSEPGRKGEESVYVPPSHLHPERSTAQTVFENQASASRGGEYGMDHFLDKGAIADSVVDRTVEQSQGRKATGENVKNQVADVKRRVSQSMKGRADQVDHAIRSRPYLYTLGAMGAGLLVGRFFKFSAR